MATGGRRVYEEGDLVGEYLLNQLSKWVLYHRLGLLARDLGGTQAQFSRIVTVSSQPEEQIFKVGDSSCPLSRLSNSCIMSDIALFLLEL